MMLPSFMADYGERLVDNGYPVIPIMPGTKVPGQFRNGEWAPYPGWTRHCDRPTKPFEVDIWRRWPGCGIGIACGSVIGVDIDVTDAELAIKLTELAKQMLGDTPCWRIGRPPKRMLVYRASAPFPGRRRHPIEVLGRGQQFVAYAIHPDTERPYEWPEDSLVETPISRLPEVDEKSCNAFLDAAARLIPDEMRTASILAKEPNGGWHGPSDPKGTREAVAAALAWIPNDDLPGDEWITIGAAIKAALGEEGRDLWIAWSRQSKKSGQSGRHDTPERRWAKLRPHSVGAGTIYWLAQQRGWKPERELILNGTAAELATQPHPAAALLEKAAIPTNLPPPPPKPYRVPPELLQVDGTLKLFVDYATASAVSPQPFFALGAAICLVGVLAGRRYRTPTNLRSNIYAVGIGDSSSGKDHARNCVKQALLSAGLERYLGGEEIASSAGLITSLQLHPARLFLLDEFGQFVKAIMGPRAPTHKATIWSELTKLYTSAGTSYITAEYADQKARPRVTIQQPCACVWAVTVPEPFWSALESGALADGSIARYLVFLTDRDYPDQNRKPESMDPPAELVKMLQAIASGAADHDYGGNLADAMQATAKIQPYTVPLTDEAEVAMDRLQDEALDLLRAHAGTYATALFGRYAENAAKLAMIAAISRNPAKPVTEAWDVAWAAALVEHCIRTTLHEADRRVADNPTEAKHKRVLEIIRKNPGIDGKTLARKTQFLSKRERDEIVDTLLESEQVVRMVHPKHGRGRPLSQFWPVSQASDADANSFIEQNQFVQ
jgi:hypothetical protein